MSHLKERKEKICLNCKTELIDRYCHHCGQENLEPKETVWHLVQHFFNDVTHFDGKFFETVKYLLRKPGFLSKEYMLGRRASYLNPIRMYVFSSAIFFLLLFSLKSPEDMVKINDGSITEAGKTFPSLLKLRDNLEGRLAKEDDGDDRNSLKKRIAKLDLELEAIRNNYGDTTTRTFNDYQLGALIAKAVNDSLRAAGIPGIPGAPGLLDSVIKAGGDTSTGTYRYSGPGAAELAKEAALAKTSDPTKTSDPAKTAKPPKHVKRVDAGQPVKVWDARNPDDNDDFIDYNTTVFGIPLGHYHNVETYDSLQKALPADKRDGWIKRSATRKMLIAQEEMRRDKKRYFERFSENMLHSISKILFISLPFFALILNILYYRRKKTYYYVSHGIFTIHVYCALFILSMAILLLNQLYHATEYRFMHIITGLLIFLIVLYLMIYLYKAMRGFYGQGRWKTLLKYMIACFLAIIVNTFLLVLFVLISAVSI